LAGLAASGAITSALRLITNAAFESSRDGLRKGASMSHSFQHQMNQNVFFLKLSLHPYKNQHSYHQFCVGLILLISTTTGMIHVLSSQNNTT